MADARLSRHDRLSRQFPVQGLWGTLEDPFAARRLTRMQSLSSALNVSFLGVVALAFSRPEMGALNVALACFYLAQAWYVGRFDANLVTLTASLCVSLLAQVAGHVIMGGYFYSGG